MHGRLRKVVPISSLRSLLFLQDKFWGFVLVLDWSKDNGCVLPSHLSFTPIHVYFPFQNKAQGSL